MRELASNALSSDIFLIAEGICCSFAVESYLICDEIICVHKLKLVQVCVCLLMLFLEI